MDVNSYHSRPSNGCGLTVDDALNLGFVPMPYRFIPDGITDPFPFHGDTTPFSLVTPEDLQLQLMDESVLPNPQKCLSTDKALALSKLGFKFYTIDWNSSENFKNLSEKINSLQLLKECNEFLCKAELPQGWNVHTYEIPDPIFADEATIFDNHGRARVNVTIDLSSSDYKMEILPPYRVVKNLIATDKPCTFTIKIFIIGPDGKCVKEIGCVENFSISTPELFYSGKVEQLIKKAQQICDNDYPKTFDE